MLIDRLWQDTRYAARSLRQQPAFALVAMLCLAIGISVNTAAFSLLNAILFRDFPGVVRQHEIAGVFIGFKTEEGATRVGRASLADWDVLRAGLPAFSGIAAYGNVPLSLSAGGEARAVRGALVSSGFFDVLGTRPATGRFISASDAPRDLDSAVVISHSLWTRVFDARPDILGQAMVIGTRQFSVIGVTPEGFFGLYPAEIIDPDFGAPEVFVPLKAASSLRTAAPDAAAIDDRWLQVFGRLRPGVTTAAAEAQASGIAAHLAATFPADRREAFAEVRTGLGIAMENVEIIGALLAAMAVPALILFVACANLANQLVARGVQRRREIAVRLSLGAPRARVVGQLLIEAALLSLAAGGAGVLLARWTLDALRAWYLPMPFTIAIDVRKHDATRAEARIMSDFVRRTAEVCRPRMWIDRSSPGQRQQR